MPPGFFLNTRNKIGDNLNVLFEAMKRLMKIRKLWKKAVVTHIHKKGEKNVTNYRGISLLNNDSKFLGICVYDRLYQQFLTLMTENRGFVRKRSVLSNMLQLLQDIHRALGNTSNESVVAFYADFSKAFNRVPHKLLVQKLDKIGVGGVLFDTLFEYLEGRKQFVGLENQCSEELPCRMVYLTDHCWVASLLYLDQRFTRNHEIQ